MKLINIILKGGLVPRTRRMVIKGEPGVYHVISRTALKGLPFKDVDKDIIRPDADEKLHINAGR